MRLTFDHAASKLSATAGSCWQVVAGPAAATISSAQRIGWRFLDAATAVDDLGQTWDFKLDSPAAIADAVKHSVDRWRTDELLTVLPAARPAGLGLQPDGDGIAEATIAERLEVRGSYDSPILVCATRAIAGLYRGAKRVLKNTPT